MLFTDQKLFLYEDTLFSGVTLDKLLGKKPPKAWQLSGLADLRETLLVIKEYYSQMPKCMWKEQDEAQVDPIWLERKGPRTFKRIVRMAVFQQQEKPRTFRRPEGETTDRPTTFHIATVVAHEANYLPWVGDQVQYLNVLYDVTRVYMDPEDYYQQSGFPLYFRIDTRIANTTSTTLGTCEKDTLKHEAGTPTPENPGDEVVHTTPPTPKPQPLEDGGSPLFSVPYTDG